MAARSKPSAAIYLITFITIAILGQVPTCVRGEELGPAVRKALVENAASLSPITVEWMEKYESQSPPEATRERLKMIMPAKTFFHPTPHRVIWQDAHIYASWDTLYQTANDGEVLVPREAAIDGKCLYIGVRNGSQPVIFKRFIPKAIQDAPTGADVEVGYFKAAGLPLPWKMQEWAEPRAKSEILRLLEQGGRLDRVSSVRVDDHDLMKVEITADNPTRKRAEQISRTPETGIRSDTPEKRKELQGRIEQQLATPTNCKMVFFLDPTLQYAVRQWEEWYEPATLLRRCTASGFQKLSGRNVWLPQRCQVDHFTFDTIPDVFTTEPLVSEVFEVSKISLERVPDTSFVINYTEPGTRVNDGTLADAKRDQYGYTRYEIPAQAEDLARVIEIAKKGGPAALPTAGLWNYRVFIALNAVIAFACAVFFILHRRKRT
jgi:hypothetical protein